MDCKQEGRLVPKISRYVLLLRRGPTAADRNERTRGRIRRLIVNYLQTEQG